MPAFSQDVRYAVRTLRKAPGFTAAAVVVLALGIGANSAMFGLVDATLVRPLPFTDPDRLVMLWERAPADARSRVAPLNFLDWSEQNHTFAAMAAVAGGDTTLTGISGTAERIPGQAVTYRFFDVLGIKPIAGRTFLPDDATPRPTVVVISERLWRRRFGADPTLVGRTITLDAQLRTVIGVVPAAFQVLSPSDCWMLLRPSPRVAAQRRPRYMQVVARLKADVTIEQARADMGLVAQNISFLSPETNKDWSVTIEPLHEAIVGDELRLTSVVLAGVVTFVLLIACANVANLLLVRGAGRTREFAVRAALGGSRNRILRQLMTESVLLAMMGGAAGLALSWAMLQVAPSIVPPGTLPESVALTFDARVTGYALAVTLATSLLFGFTPAWHATRIPLAEVMSAGGRGSTRGAASFRTVLAVGEIAAAVLLLSGAGLLLRTLISLNAVDPGYRADSVLTMYVTVPINRYATPERLLGFYQAVEQGIAALPGVRVAAVGGNVPLDGSNIVQRFEIVGDPAPDGASQRVARYQIVSARYFQALDIPVLEGRAFTDQDTASTSQVCIVNEAFVRRYLHGPTAIGTFVSVGSVDLREPKPVVREIVGVIRQVKERRGEEQDAVEIYVPVAQNPWYTASIVLQTAANPMSFVSPVKAAIARVDKDQPVTRVRTMADVAAESTSRPRFRAQIVAAFAALALALAAVGLFGVLAFAVHQRTREFGVRLALGARSGDVLRLVLGAGLRMTAIGVAIGLAAAVSLTRLLAALLFGVTPLDPVTFLAVPVILGVIALLACAAPALRAAHVDPAAALRSE